MRVLISLFVRQPPETLYDIVADVNSYQSYIPFCVKSKITGRVKRDPAGEVIFADLTVGFGPLEETYTSFVELVPYKRVVAKISPTECSPLSDLLATWEFTPCDGINPRRSLHRKEGNDRKFPYETGLQPAGNSDRRPATEVVFYTRFGFKNPLYSVACDFAISDSNICDKVLNAFKERAQSIKSGEIVDDSKS